MRVGYSVTETKLWAKWNNKGNLYILVYSKDDEFNVFQEKKNYQQKSCLLVVHTKVLTSRLAESTMLLTHFAFLCVGRCNPSLSENPVVLSFFSGGIQGLGGKFAEGQWPASLISAGLVSKRASAGDVSWCLNQTRQSAQKGTCSSSWCQSMSLSVFSRCSCSHEYGSFAMSGVGGRPESPSWWPARLEWLCEENYFVVFIRNQGHWRALWDVRLFFFVLCFRAWDDGLFRTFWGMKLSCPCRQQFTCIMFSFTIDPISTSHSITSLDCFRENCLFKFLYQICTVIKNCHVLSS